MGDEEVEARIKLETAGSACGSCCGMGGVVKDSAGRIVNVRCKGERNEYVAVQGKTCPKFGPLVGAAAQAYLPKLSRHMRSEGANAVLA